MTSQFLISNSPVLFSTLLFYIFSFVLLSSAVIVVSAKNAVHAVLFLILAFLNAAALFIMLGAEFLAMILMIVYVGAIAVLFLFVVMMLNIDQNQISKKFQQDIMKNLPLIFIIGLVFFIEIFIMVKYSSSSDNNLVVRFLPIDSNVSNINSIGKVLYTDFFYPFQLSGAILFVAMIGAIILTIRKESRFIRKQDISKQISREKSQTIEIVKVEIGQGIDI